MDHYQAQVLGIKGDGQTTPRKSLPEVPISKLIETPSRVIPVSKEKKENPIKVTSPCATNVDVITMETVGGSFVTNVKRMGT